MCMINHILSHMHGCANWCHETSLTLSIDNWLNAVCHCQCHFSHSDHHFYHPDTHFPESCLSIHHKLPYWQHSPLHHSEGEALPPLCTHFVLICAKEWCHSEESNMANKCNHTKQDGQQANTGQCKFIASFVNIQENTNTALTAPKHNTSTGLLQETCSFYWHNTLMHKCPKRCQSHGIFAKSSALNDILCFQMKFKFGPYSNSAIKLPIQPSELIKKHAHKCPIPDASHLHEKMLQTQTTSQGSSHTHVTARKACQTMCIINHSLSHLHGCAKGCHETSSILSMDIWLNVVCHCQCHSHTLTFISTTLTCIPLNHVSPFITNYLTSSIHFSPILKENLCHIFVPFLCWCVQRSGAILRSPTWSANADTQKRMVSKQILDNICLLPFYFTFTKMQTQHWLCQSIAHLSVLLRKTCSFYWHNTMMHIVPKYANCRVYLAKQCSERHFLLSKKIQVPSILKLNKKASYSNLGTHQKTCTQVPHP